MKEKKIKTGKLKFTPALQGLKLQKPNSANSNNKFPPQYKIKPLLDDDKPPQEGQPKFK